MVIEIICRRADGEITYAALVWKAFRKNGKFRDFVQRLVNGAIERGEIVSIRKFEQGVSDGC